MAMHSSSAAEIPNPNLGLLAQQRGYMASDFQYRNMRGYGSQVFMVFKITTSLEPLQ
ncbi:hypothetical protein DY000_02002288 [Brassica cretica]|uniref:Uncharacterized protein n=1 Tax=Brassica cretica TaxID=69181 RepID=A0ABQ7CC29_BRACR|nr:hypothetical protein DY000_02002288 [Brassica cretica]